MKKIIEPTGEVCIKFTEDELDTLNIKPGDKFSWKTTEDGILLEKYKTIEIDLSEFSRDTLEMFIAGSIEQDITISEYIEKILLSYIENQ